jgi:hypothetical protein
MYSDEEHIEGEPEELFTDFDNLRYQWRQFVNAELTAFKIIKSDLYGTGCVCDLQTMFETNDLSPENVMSLMPRVSDCASECIYQKYVELSNKFLGQFHNMQGAPMTIVDLGDEEQFFYGDFEKVAKQKVVWNTWDLFRTTNVQNTK